MKIVDVKWIEIDGSIFVDKTKPKKNNDFRFGFVFQSRDSISFNVGPSLAKYIVNLHNKSLMKSDEDIAKAYLDHIDG